MTTTTHEGATELERVNGWKIVLCHDCRSLPYQIQDGTGKTHSFQPTHNDARSVLARNCWRGRAPY